jgi:hypothetical protein
LFRNYAFGLEVPETELSFRLARAMGAEPFGLRAEAKAEYDSILADWKGKAPTILRRSPWRRKNRSAAISLEPSTIQIVDNGSFLEA